MKAIDVAVVGGGPAGLSASLILGRCRRTVVVIDAGQTRNRRSDALNGYLTRDGIPPARFLRAARREVRGYGVKFVRGTAIHAAIGRDGVFRIRLRSGRTLLARKLLLATGVRDRLPAIPGLSRMYGTSVHHCPYCDGWEHRGRMLVAFGDGRKALGLALSLRTWSDTVVACTNGVALTRAQEQRARLNGIAVRSEPVARLQGRAGLLRRVIFRSGPPLRCDALFFNTGQLQRSDLPRRLGCSFKSNGGVHTDKHQCTGVPGLYLAGDADKDVQFVVVAAGEGATAAVAINQELQAEDQLGSARSHRAAR